MSKEEQGSLRSLGLGFGAALLGWALAIVMFAAHVTVAFEYSVPRFNDNCTQVGIPALMWVLGLLMFVAILAASVGATYAGARVWRVNLRSALLLIAFLLAPLLVAWPLAIWEANELAIIWSDCGD